MIYTNGIMKLELVKRIGEYTLFERINTGDDSTRYWVIGWFTEMLDTDGNVTWASGTYFEGDREYALEVLCNK